MRNKKNVSRVKISLGYALMLAVLLFSLFFVNEAILVDSCCMAQTGQHSALASHLSA